MKLSTAGTGRRAALSKDRAPGCSLEDPDATRLLGRNSVRELADGAKHLDAAL
jgi:hypothetical protein